MITPPLSTIVRLMAVALGLHLTFLATAQELKPIALPAPQTAGGKPFLDTVRERQSTREFTEQPLAPQQLANLLWVAYGVNRLDGHRTVPSAMNSQELELYVFLTEGVYRYDASANQLAPVAAGDLRGKVSGQAYVKQAPVALVFVADHSRLVKARPEDKDFYAAVDTGYVSQNVYLYCAAEGLGTVVYSVDKSRPELARVLGLKPEQKSILGQSVGYAKPGGGGKKK